MIGQVRDVWESGDGYEQYVGRWSRQVAPRFIDWLNLGPGLRWLDLGCGTGALSEAIWRGAAPARVFGVEPSRGFLRAARQNLTESFAAAQGSAAAIPLAAGSVDAVVSGLVLNFIPDLPRALGEMARAARPGGTVAAYVWDYGGKMEMMQAFWSAAAEHDEAARALDEGERFPICRREALEQAFTAAGLAQVRTGAVEIETNFASFDDYWQPFMGGQGAAPAYLATLGAEKREAVRQSTRARLPIQKDGSIHLAARVWAARGEVDGH